MSTLFQSVELAPRDPILGLNEQFNADPRSTKVNLGVGVYYDDNGKIPLLAAVHKAEVARVEAAAARGYLPIEGIAGYNKGAQELVLGKNSSLIADGRVLTMQALGGTGALKIGADFIKQLVPNAKVAISDPSWENHRALFERAGFDVVNGGYEGTMAGVSEGATAGGAAAVGVGFGCQQHAAHIGVNQDRVSRFGGRFDTRQTAHLQTVFGIGQCVLIGHFRQAQGLVAHAQTGCVHHDEHGGQTPVGLPHQAAHSAV